MALKSRAEVQLLQVLNQNQVKSASFYLKEEQQKAEQQEEGETQQLAAKHDLARYRKENRKNARPVREEDEMVAQVRQLQDNFFVVGASSHRDANRASSESPSQIEANAILRRDKHMAAQQQYTEQVKQISEDIEGAIIKAADLVKEALAHIDLRLQSSEQSLANEELLLRSSNDDILRMWSDMEAICKQRTQLITQFAQELDSMELARTKRVRGKLKTLTELLMDTAYALPPEVERVIEAEAFEVNVVVISNRNVYADLIARMATADVDVFVDTRLAWEKGQLRWRHIRHDDAVKRFQDLLDSAVFTDPEERREILNEIRLFQEHIHNEKRLAALKQLEDAGAQLTSKQAAAVLKNISAVQAEEEEKNHAFFERLMAVHIDKTHDAQQLREALRLEIHGFGAMAKEGEIEFSRETLAGMLVDESLDEFFRMAGGLRGELDLVVKKLCTAELIYRTNLHPLTTSLQVLLSALPLEGVMEAQGKGAERKALQATLEKIRKAGKHGILPLLPSLQTQTVMLSNLTDMSEEFKAELEDILVQLEQLIQEYGSGESESASTTSDGKTTSDAGGLSTLSSTGSNRPQSRSTVSRSASSTSSGMTASSGASSSVSPPKSKPSDLGLNTAYNFIDLQAIRKVQRRLGTLVYASELSQPIQQQLGFISDQLALQATANGIVDQVITTECEELVDSRQQESRLFLEGMGKAMEQQSAHLHDQTERLAKFCLNVALCMEQSVEKVRYVDLSAMDLLDHLKDDDEEKLAERESQFLQSCARLRHAPNDAVLQEEFQLSSTLLHQVEAEYRAYHKKGGLAANHHVLAIEKQREVFLRQLCEHFGLFAKTSSENEDALDVDRFLSAKYIEDIVNPPPRRTNMEQVDGVENPQEGPADGKSADARAVGSTPRSDNSVDRQEKQQYRGNSRSAASPRPAEPPAAAKEIYRTSSGLEAEVAFAVPEVVSRILSQKDTDEAVETSSVPSEAESPADPAEAIPAKAATQDRIAGETTSDETVPTDGEGGDDQAAARAAKEQLQQKLVMGKVALEFLRLEIPGAVMEQMLTTLREAILSKYDRDAKKTTEITAETRDQRLADCNLLLEERLRMHWPRKGRLDVQVFQPRMGELMSHRQRQERQIRNVLKKVDAQEVAFASQVKLAVDHTEQARVKQVSCQAQLPMQSSLAALQGQEGKSKKLLKAFKTEGSEKVDALRAMVVVDLNTLVSSLQDFLRACTSQLFPDLTSCDIISGCDYHPDEISSLKEKVMAIESQLREKIGERELKINDIVQSQGQVLQLSQSFKSRYQMCMQSLSMKDGLGQKYGLPRRTAQERYRSEVTRCDERSAKTDELLASLHAMVETNEPKPSDPKRATGSTDLSSTILRTLLQLRAKIYNRGRYFGFLKNISQLELSPVEFDSSGGTKPGEILRDRDIVDEQDQQVPTPFLDFVQDVSARCREDTRQLYQQEGKLDELPNGSVPPSLEEYLHGLADKARSYVLQQELKFREQVHFFEELLALAPETALLDFVERSKESLRRRNDVLTNELEGEFALFTEQKKAHMVELRPELCSPNNTDQLQALSDREVSRSEQTVVSLQHFRVQAMTVQAQVSCDFEREFVAMFRCFMGILDTCVMTLDDLKPFSGEELPKLKRKSLKRLRKVARIQEFGDAREVKRTDKELEKLTQLGEVPRFPKRSWPAVPHFGAHVLWEAQQAKIVSHDEHQQLPSDDAIKALDCATFAVPDDAACVGLLTHAHRSLVGVRDAVYASYVDFCKAQNEQVVENIQEKLRDEAKWMQQWKQNIANMQ